LDGLGVQMTSSVNIHYLIVEFIRKKKEQEIFRLIRDQQKLLDINQIVDGLALIHHAAQSNNLFIF
jgi:hypothetical protein